MAGTVCRSHRPHRDAHHLTTLAASLAAVSDDFSWSPEPELIDFRDEARSRASLEALGEATWREAMDWLYGQAMVRPMQVRSYPDARDAFFGPGSLPAPAPISATPWREVLAEFRERIAPSTYNAQHPGSFSYFTPPPLPGSIARRAAGAVDPSGRRRLARGPDRHVRGRRGHGVAPRSRGVRARWLGRAHQRRGHGEPHGTHGGTRHLAGEAPRHRRCAPRAPPWKACASTRAIRRISRLPAALGMLGFPRDTLVVIDSDERFRLQARQVAEAIERDRAAGLTPLAIRP